VYHEWITRKQMKWQPKGFNSFLHYWRMDWMPEFGPIGKYGPGAGGPIIHFVRQESGIQE
ncbi:hypothetical protein, partial [Heyndrickxia coagulans]